MRPDGPTTVHEFEGQPGRPGTVAAQDKIRVRGTEGWAHVSGRSSRPQGRSHPYLHPGSASSDPRVFPEERHQAGSVYRTTCATDVGRRSGLMKLAASRSNGTPPGGGSGFTWILPIAAQRAPTSGPTREKSVGSPPPFPRRERTRGNAQRQSVLRRPDAPARVGERICNPIPGGITTLNDATTSEESADLSPDHSEANTRRARRREQSPDRPNRHDWSAQGSGATIET